MKQKNLIYVVLPMVAIVLELLPYGAVLNFARPAEDGTIGSFKELYSYFDLMPFGYANFGPLLTAILTCVLLVLGAILLFGKKDKMLKGIKWVSGVAIATSLMPLMFGLSFFTIVGALISLVLIIEFVVAVKMGRSDI